MPKPRRPPALKRDHARPRTPPAPTNAELDAHFCRVIQPAVFGLGAAARQLGLRNRLLTLPVMVAVMLSLVRRQAPAVSEALRLPKRAGLLWVPAGLVASQQALSLRVRSLPEPLVAQLWAGVSPLFQDRAAARTRPLAPVIARLAPRYPRIWAVDGTTLEELFKKVGLLRKAPGTALGGTVEAILDLGTRLPVHLWSDPDPAAHALRFRERIQGAVTAGTLLVLDAGDWAFPFFDWLTAHEVAFVIRARAVRAETVVRVLHESASVRDRIVQFGVFRSHPCAHPVRLVEVRVGKNWRPYATNVLDPAVLSVADVVELYARRWRIEEAFLVTKRLLGLSYLWSGAVNAIALQVWATWIVYASLVDLTDAVAEELGQPFEAMSVEMTYRGLYHFVSACQRGEASDPVAYLAAQDDLGLVKRRRK